MPGKMEKFFLIGLVGSILAGLFALFQTRSVKQYPEGSKQMKKIAAAIRTGANAYLKQQYKTVMIVFAIVFLLLAAVSFGSGGKLLSHFTPFAFISGGAWSMLAGFIGMRIATSSNARTAQDKISPAAAINATEIGFAGRNFMSIPPEFVGLIGKNHRQGFEGRR